MYNNNNKAPLGPPWLTLKIQLEKALLLKVFFFTKKMKWSETLANYLKAPFYQSLPFSKMSLGNEKPYLHINIFACFLLGHALLCSTLAFMPFPKAMKCSSGHHQSLKGCRLSRLQPNWFHQWKAQEGNEEGFHPKYQGFWLQRQRQQSSSSQKGFYPIISHRSKSTDPIIHTYFNKVPKGILEDAF